MNVSDFLSLVPRDPYDFEIQVRIGVDDWENTSGEIFSTFADAQDELNAHYASMDEAGVEYHRADYRIRPITKES